MEVFGKSTSFNQRSRGLRYTSIKNIPTPVTVKSFHENNDTDLAFWQREMNIAITMAHIRDDRSQVAFAMSHLDGRTKDWAITWKVHRPGYLARDEEGYILTPKVGCRQRSNLFYAVKITAHCTAKLEYGALPKAVMVIVFIKGLTYDPLKAIVFHQSLTALGDAIMVALREDYCHRQAFGQSANPMKAVTAATKNPGLMDLAQ
ncbi:uncharacterized protein PHALS_00141 [Plasmopara halstedii]|uniref:Uncharacterized protein n=1 Tax=Plasmopara halstedii TaxID=4781 RepID=A0A0N7L3G5_PLAHL|nr:uncharacterized protein PHALS_00141 [Plasmopara halstedii]CEG35811.1 hypothetical protein PHALS_00141 [Plasmopara halstedii]|eukprot:XP_024572180.1 hypothetical protein PHALS_00141 [Plasmopara halstedii]